MNEYTPLLTSLGLSEKETALYLALLELGTAEVADIARAAEVKRSTSYLLLEGLASKGFVAPQEGSGRMYRAEDPQKILAYQKTKVSQLEQALPGLLGLASHSQLKPGTRFFTGKEGIKAVYEETLLQAPGSEMLSLGSAEAVEQNIEGFVDWYIKRRVAHNLPMRSIIPATEEGLKTALRDPEELRETRTVAPDELREPVEINIYGNKVSVVSFMEDELIGVIIESKVVAAIHRQMFEVMWKNASPLRLQ